MELVRHVHGRRPAAVAWGIYWRLKGKEHLAGAPELWNHDKRIL